MAGCRSSRDRHWREWRFGGGGRCVRGDRPDGRETDGHDVRMVNMTRRVGRYQGGSYRRGGAVQLAREVGGPKGGARGWTVLRQRQAATVSQPVAAWPVALGPGDAA